MGSSKSMNLSPLADKFGIFFMKTTANIRNGINSDSPHDASNIDMNGDIILIGEMPQFWSAAADEVKAIIKKSPNKFCDINGHVTFEKVLKSTPIIKMSVAE